MHGNQSRISDLTFLRFKLRNTSFGIGLLLKGNSAPLDRNPGENMWAIKRMKEYRDVVSNQPACEDVTWERLFEV